MGFVAGQPPVMMQPGKNYKFPGKMVYEIPVPRYIDTGWNYPTRPSTGVKWPTTSSQSTARIYSNPNYFGYGGDISIPDLSRPSWLDRYQEGGELKPMSWIEYLDSLGINDPKLRSIDPKSKLDSGNDEGGGQQLKYDRYWNASMQRPHANTIFEDVDNLKAAKVIDMYNALFWNREKQDYSGSDYHKFSDLPSDKIDLELSAYADNSIYKKDALNYIKNFYNSPAEDILPSTFNLENSGSGTRAVRDVPIEYTHTAPRADLTMYNNPNWEKDNPLFSEDKSLEVFGSYDSMPLSQPFARDWKYEYPKDSKKTGTRIEFQEFPKPTYNYINVPKRYDEKGNEVVSKYDVPNPKANTYYDFSGSLTEDIYKQKNKLHQIYKQNVANLKKFDPNAYPSLPVDRDLRREYIEKEYASDPYLFYGDQNGEDKYCTHCEKLSGSQHSTDNNIDFFKFKPQYPSSREWLIKTSGAKPPRPVYLSQPNATSTGQVQIGWDIWDPKLQQWKVQHFDTDEINRRREEVKVPKDGGRDVEFKDSVIHDLAPYSLPPDIKPGTVVDTNNKPVIKEPKVVKAPTFKSGGWLDTYDSMTPVWSKNPEGNWVVKAQKGLQYTVEPTRADSLELLNNSINVLNYYNSKNYDNYLTKYYNNDDIKERSFAFIEGLHKKFDPNTTRTTPTGYRTVPLNEYYKPVDKNKFYQRETADGILDTRAPMQLYDRRILPTTGYTYGNIKKGDRLLGDTVGISGYDPLSITPWDMLTEDQKKLRVERFGRDGVPENYNPDKAAPHIKTPTQESVDANQVNMPQHEWWKGRTALEVLNEDVIPEDRRRQKPKVVPAPDFRHGGWLDKYQDRGEVKTTFKDWGTGVPKPAPPVRNPLSEDALRKGYTWSPELGVIAPQVEITAERPYDLVSVPGGHGSMVTAKRYKNGNLSYSPETAAAMNASNEIARSNNLDPVTLALAATAAPISATVARLAPAISGALNAPLTIGSTVIPGATMGNVLGAMGAADALVNRLPQIPGQLSRGEYLDAVVNAGTGALDLYGANMVSPLFKGASSALKQVPSKGPGPLMLFGDLADKAENVNRVVTPTSKASSWTQQELPGLHLKSTMDNGPISKIVEPKTGLVNVEQALAIIAKESGGADKVSLIKPALGIDIPKKMDYNEFRQIVQNQLIPLERNLVNHRSNYGINRLGYNSGDNTPDRLLDFVNLLTHNQNLLQSATSPEDISHIQDQIRLAEKAIKRYSANTPLENQTLLLSNKTQFGKGSKAHANPLETLGHIHFLTDADTPDVLTVTQIQSDAFQGPYRVMPDSFEDALKAVQKQEEHTNRLRDLYSTAKPRKDSELYPGANRFRWYELEDGQIVSAQEIEDIDFHDRLNDAARRELKNFGQKSLLDKNHQERFLQELVAYAGERGDINKLRLPTSETAAKVQGYNPAATSDEVITRYNDLKGTPEFDEIFGNLTSEQQRLLDQILSGKVKGDIYSPEHKTILKKYSEYPKTLKKLFDIDTKIVTDPKGNTWYEFDIPKSFKEGKGQIKAFEHGGSTKQLSKYQSKNTSAITKGWHQKEYTDPEKFAKANKAFNDSLDLVNKSYDFLKKESPGHSYHSTVPYDDVHWTADGPGGHFIDTPFGSKRWFLGTTSGIDTMFRKPGTEFNKIFNESFTNKIKPIGFLTADYPFPIYKVPTEEPVYKEIKNLTPLDARFELPKPKLDIGRPTVKSQGIRIRPMMTADQNTTTGQYQSGKYIWDPQTKSWKVKMLSPEAQQENKQEVEMKSKKYGGWLDKYQGVNEPSQVERRDPNVPFFPSSMEQDLYESQYSQPEVTITPDWTEAELERNRLRDEYIRKDKNVFRHWYDKLGYDKDNVTKRANQFAYNKLAKQYLKGDKDKLTPEQRKFIEKSEYASRLQPSVGSRFAEGLRQSFDARVPNSGINLQTLANLAAPLEYPGNLIRGAVQGEFADALKGQTPSPYFVSSDLAGTSPREASALSTLMTVASDPLFLAGDEVLGGVGKGARGLRKFFRKSNNLPEVPQPGVLPTEPSRSIDEITANADAFDDFDDMSFDPSITDDISSVDPDLFKSLKDRLKGLERNIQNEELARDRELDKILDKEVPQEFMVDARAAGAKGPEQTGFFTEAEINEKLAQYDDYLQQRKYFDEMFPEDPQDIIMDMFSGTDRIKEREQMFENLFPNAKKPDWFGKEYRPEDRAFLANKLKFEPNSPFHKYRDKTSELGLKSLLDFEKKTNSQLPSQKYISQVEQEMSDPTSWYNTNPKDFVMEFRGQLDLDPKYIDSLSEQELRELAEDIQIARIRGWKESIMEQLNQKGPKPDITLPPERLNKYGGPIKWLDKYQDGGSRDMPLGLPLKEQNVYLLPEYNQPMANGYILPDPNRPQLLNTGATEYKYSYGMNDRDVQVPSVVAGQYIGDQAIDRYMISGEEFKPMLDPGAYSKYYNMLMELGLMQKKKGGEPYPSLGYYQYIGGYRGASA
jgi:hypothetical protein